MSGLPLFTQWVADESNAANEVKTELPVLVVMGNPPYSYESKNNGEWISNLIQDYYQVDGGPLSERNPKGLQDDYVKFMRFAQWRIDQTGEGILAFITNHGYLANPTFRGMRQSLLSSFDDLYILDLHGSTKKGESAADGAKDENVFDILPGVAIALFVKTSKAVNNGFARVWHAEFFGNRQVKYERLGNQQLDSTQWAELRPKYPYYLFIPVDSLGEFEYLEGWKLTEIFPINSIGISTSRDKLAVRLTAGEMLQTVKDFAALSVDDARGKYDLGADTLDWKVSLAQDDLRQSHCSAERIHPLLYRVFDTRYTYYTGRSRGFLSRPRPEVSQHMLEGDNLMLCSNRQVNNDFRHVFVSKMPIDGNAVSLASRERTYGFLLYIRRDARTNENSQLNLNISHDEIPDVGNRTPNLSPTFIAEMAAKLGLTFNPLQRETGEDEFGPEDVFHYIYALLHSPTYRERYAEFLKIDFPRVPLTGDAALFRALAGLGRELAALHLLEAPQVNQFITRYPVPGDNRVAASYPQFTHAAGEAAGRVHLNPTQYFDGVPPEVWAFHVGGYQVLDKWLKDRRGRQLSYDDLTHYQRVVVALQRTLALMTAIDAAIPAWPLA